MAEHRWGDIAVSTSRVRLLGAFVAFVLLVFAGIGMSAQPAAAATEAANLSQCTNGAVGPPLVLSACVNGQWVNGNANSAKSHWKEGQFIAYRADLTGLGTGSHTYTINYHTVDTSKHAIDYLGSYDATEMSTTTPGPENENNSNPCFDILGSGTGSGCTAPGTQPVPAASSGIPAADLAGEKTCNGASGLPTTPTQIAGTVDLFAPSAAEATMQPLTAATPAVAYVSQNVTQGGGVCNTTVSITFNLAGTAPAGGWEVVLAWGGHIASALDWGVGNSASAISGSPYHMMQDSIDSTGLGQEDRALMANAVAGPPTVATQVSKTSLGVGGTLTDTATLTGSAGTVTGTVQFQLCSNTTTGCPQGTGTNIGTPVTLGANGAAPGTATSPAFGTAASPPALTPGNYCVGVVYVNDGNSFYSNTYSGSATNECFTVTTAAPTMTTLLSSSSILNSGSVTDTATLAGATTGATGTITISVYSGNSSSICTGTPVTSATASPTTNGNGSYSATFSGLAAGSYEFQAMYTGDGNNQSATSACGSEPLTVQNQPAVSTQLSSSSILNTASVTDTATLSGATTGATGAITISVYSGNSSSVCTGTPVTSATASPTTNGNGAYTATFSGLAAGSYEFQASYVGDTKNQAATSVCGSEPLTVTNQPTLTTSLSSGSILSSGSVTDTATLAGSTSGATGTITISVYSGNSSSVCTGTPVTSATASPTTNGNGAYTATFSSLAAGNYEFQATYAGDAKNKSATSACGSEPLTVTNQPTLTTQLSLNAISNTGSVTDTATLAGATSNATGTITISVYSGNSSTVCTGTPVTSATASPTTNGNGTYSATFSSLAAGSYEFQATYAGDAKNQPATSSCGSEPLTVTNGPALATRLSSSSILNTASVSDTATLTGATSDATGAITISVYSGSDGTACTGTAVQSATASPATNGNGGYSATFSGLAAGSYEFQASYAGDAKNQPATSMCGTEPLTVTNQPTLTTQLSSSSILNTSSVVDTATLAGATGDATGPITISVYSGSDASACVVGNFVTSMPAAPSTNGNGAYLATFGGLAAGSYEFQATYAGDAKNQPANSACGTEPLTVTNQPTLTTQLSSSSILNTGSVTDTATLAGATSDATGAITISVYSGSDGTACTPANFVTSGTASPTTDGNADYSAMFSGLAAGSYEFQASYAGDANNQIATSACGTEPLTVTNQPMLTTQLSSSSILNNGSVTDTATLAGSTSDSTGSITISVYSGSDASACVVGNLVASLPATPATLGDGGYSATFTNLAAGSYEFQATYAGDAKNQPATSSCGSEPLTVTNQPTLTTQLSSSSILNTASVTDTATLAGATSGATGPITISVYSGSDGTACMGVPVASLLATPTTSGDGAYSATFSSLAAGSYEFQASYAGDNKNQPATSSCGSEPLTVTNQPTLTTQLSSSSILNTASVTDTATLAGSTSGSTGSITISVYSGNDASACVVGNLVATMPATPATLSDGGYSATFSSLAAGSYEFQASYAGDNNNQPATSSCGSEPLTVTNQPTLTTQLSSSSILNTASVTDTATLAGSTSDSTGPITISVYSGSDASACVVGNLVATMPATPATSGNGSYSATFSSIPAGSYEFQASYAGDAKNQPATSSCGSEPLTVTNQPTLTTQLSSSSILNTAPVTDTATLAGATSDATGPITISVYSGSDGTVCTPANFVTSGTASPTTNGNGTYSATFSSLAAGSYEFQASYAGDAKNQPAGSVCGTEPLTVTNQPTLTTQLSSSSILNTGSVTDTATLAGSTSDSTGSITISVYSGSDGNACVVGNLVASLPAAPATSGDGAYSATFSSLAAGSYEFQATYAGDNKNQPATSVCGTEPLTVTNQPTLTTQLSSSSILNTASVTDTATLAGSTSDSTGPITIDVYSGSDGTVCTLANEVATMPATPATSGDGAYSATFSSLAAGNYEFQATYAGDAKNQPATSSCGSEPLTVTNQPMLTTQLSSSSILNTGSVTDTATLAGSTSDSTGPITISVYSGNSSTVCTGTPVTSATASPATNGDGSYSATFSSIPAGSYEFQASYAGDAKNQPATSSCGSEPLTVTNQPTLTTQLSSSSILNTASVTDTATLAGATSNATGTITISVYSGNSSTVCTGTPVTSATASPTTNGNGTYSATFSSLAAGNYEFQASYAGDAKNQPATSSCGSEPLTVTNQPTLTTQLSASAISNTASVTDTATLAGSTSDSTGPITIDVYSGSDGTVCTLANEVATMPATPATSGDGAYSATFSSLPAGNYEFQATYAGDAKNQPASSMCGTEPLTVTNGPALTTQLSHSSILNTGSVTDTATLSGSTTGATGLITINVYSGSDGTACTLANEVATMPATPATNGDGGYSAAFSNLAAGSYEFQASYAGDAKNQPATSMCGTEPLTVTNQPTLTTQLSHSSILNTGSVSDAATLAGSTSGATGPITINVYSGSDGTACTAANLVTSGSASPATNGDGTYSATFSNLASGSYEFQASYAGDAKNQPAASVCGTEPLTVTNQPTLTTQLSHSSILDTGSVSDAATLAGSTSGATGPITINVYSGSDGTACTAANLVTSGSASPATNGDGTYSATFSSLAAGKYEFQASYAGDAKNQPAASVCGTEPLTVTRAPAVSTQLSSSSILNTGSVTDTATLSGATSDATGTITISVYSGNSSTVCTGTPVTSATASPTTNGNGSYSATFSSLAAGNYEFQASYAGDAKNQPATSSCGSEPLTVQNQPAVSTQLSSGSILNTGSVTDTATLSGATTGATGAITISVYSGNSSSVCTGTPVTSATASPTTNGNGTYTATFSSLAAGNYEFQASYAGDAKNKAATSTCGSEPLTVQNQPAVSTQLSSSSILNTASVTDTATLSGATTGATGTITISVYSGNSSTVCTGTPVTSATASPTTNGNGTYSATFSSLAAGSYEFQATYAGDAKNKSATSACGTEPLTVTNPVVSQITPTNTTCSQFASGGAQTEGPITYSTKGTTLSQVSPGVIFYWVRLTVSAAGSQTFTVTQMTTYSPTSGTKLFSLGSGSNAYNSSCGGLSATIAGTDASRTVTFTAPTAGTYYIGLKYSPSAITGSGPAATKFVSPYNYLYTFATTGVSGSTSTVQLNHK